MPDALHASVADPPHPFDRAVALTPLEAGVFAGHTSPDYWNMVGPYGGITAAVMLRALLDDPRRTGEPLSLTVNYCAPVREGRFRITVEILRAGRTTQHASLRLLQDDPSGSGEPAVVAQALAVTGVRRPLWGHQALQAPAAPPPEGLARRMPRAGIRWVARYEIRHPRPLLEIPAAGEAMLNWVRDDPPRPLDYPALASIADHFYRAIYALRETMVPIATVSMNIYFHAGAAVLADIGDSYLLGSSRSQVYDGGFHDAEGQLWYRDRLILTTQQVVWYRD